MMEIDELTFCVPQNNLLCGKQNISLKSCIKLDGQPSFTDAQQSVIITELSKFIHEEIRYISKQESQKDLSISKASHYNAIKKALMDKETTFNFKASMI